MNNASTLLWSALETFFSPREQVTLFLCSVLLGAGLGIIFDCFRALRVLFLHTKFFVAVEDILFLLIWGIALLTFSMQKGRGEVRFFFLAGNILGFTLYLFTVGSVVISTIKAFAGAIFWAFRGIYRLLIAPIVKFIVIINKGCRYVFSYFRLKFKKFASNSQMHLKDGSKVLYNKIIRKKIVKGVKTVGNGRSKVRRKKKIRCNKEVKKTS